MKKLMNLSAVLLLFAVALFQGGCIKDGNNAEYPAVTAANDTIYGILKFKQSTGGASEVVAWPFGVATFNAIVNTSEILATATVNADGSFMLVLPGTVAGGYFSSLANVATELGGSLKATPSTIRFIRVLHFEVQYHDNSVPKSFTPALNTLNTDLSVNKTYYFNFYDLDGSFAGTSSAGNIFNWTFTKGWGMVESSAIGGSSSAFNSKSVSSAQEGAIWLN